jgi:hypothetical protein
LGSPMPSCSLGGVGQRAGLPSWGDFIEQLAVVAERYEPDIARLMRTRAKAKLLDKAAGFFKLCQMPESEKYRALGEPFSEGKYEHSYLRPLVSLPFAAIVTTNYDKSLLDAWADVHRRAPQVADLGDATLSAATHWTTPFVARVHGRAEVPETMVVCADDFERVQSNDRYIEFLRHVFRYRRCLILGYSFLDPAITSVLEYVRQACTPGVQPCHLAFVPDGCDELAARLAGVSVECVLFKLGEGGPDDYGELWGGISAAARDLAGRGPAAAFPTSLEPARHLLASSYVRAKMGPYLPALSEVIIEGAALGILSEAGPEGLTREEVAQEIHECVALTLEEARRVVVGALDALVALGACRPVDGRFVCGPSKKRLESDIGVLVRGALDRLSLRRGRRTAGESGVGKEAAGVVHEVLEYALLMRGWDLGAEFAGASVQVDLWSVLGDFIEDKGRALSPALRADVASSCLDLLARPTDREARILADIGRLSFAVDVVLQHGRGPVLHRRVLPERIYLDASVAMPAIVPGHPLRPVYSDALNAWREACVRSGAEPRLMLADVFMDEILVHRGKALEIVANLDLEDPEKLRRQMLFRGAEFTNVFVGSYASWVGRGASRRIPFREWLGEHAPYVDASGLDEQLARNGIETVRLDFDRGGEAGLRAIRGALQAAYDEDERSTWDRKPDVLIADEARQLAKLKEELEGGRRSVFVSADRRLRRLAVGPVLGYAGAATVSHVGLVELVDLLVGVRTDGPSLARLIWGVHAHDQRLAVRNYLVDLALGRRDEAMVMSLPTILDAVVEAAGGEAEREGLMFWSRAPEEQARVAKYLDRVEDKFFEAMDEAVAKYRREHEAG